MSTPPEPQPIAQQRDEQQLEQLRLANAKLALEVSGLSRQQRWYAPWIQITPLLTAAVALAGFAFGLIQYGEQQSKNRAQQQAQADREQVTAEREFMRPWLDAQRETYRRALHAAAVIASTDNPKARNESIIEFWQLYQGEMILVETKTVSGAMVRFGYCLNVEKCSLDEMNTRCRELATAMAASMAATAKMTYSQFVENQFRYTSEIR